MAAIGMYQAKLKIVQAGERVLRAAARPISREELQSREIQGLIDFMRETMRDAPGVGLAAPQIGVPLQLAVIEDRAELLKNIPPAQLAERQRTPVPFQVIVNPTMTLDGQALTFFEGCLSFAGFCALVPRASRVRVDCLNEKGDAVHIDAEGWYARILQHEIDHLAGVLYVDRMVSRSLTTVDNLGRYWNNLPIREVLDELGIAYKVTS